MRSPQEAWESILYECISHRTVTIFSHLFSTNNFATERHTETKIYVHHSYPRTLYECVRGRTSTIFSPLSSTNNFSIETLHRNEDFRTSPIPTYVVYVLTHIHYFWFAEQYKQLCHRNVSQKRRFPYITHTHVHCMNVYVHTVK